MMLVLALAATLLGTFAAQASELRELPAGVYRPLFRAASTPQEIPVAAFRLAATPVTNDEFLEFVRTNPQWQRSQVKRIFADAEYLRHWAGDLDLGATAQANQPVTFVSWFAAKAYCAWKGARLPATAEWEFAAGAGFTSINGASEPDLAAAITRWYSTPSPATLPPVAAGRANFFGVHDLHGLIWEWTCDFNSALVTGDARGDSGLDRQLFCGAGSLGANDRSNFAAFMRYGFRSSLKASYTGHNLGFRCAAELQAPKPPCCREVPAGGFSARSLYQLESKWTTDAGSEIPLGALRGRPQVIAMIFASCEYACPVLVHDMKRIEQALPPAWRDSVSFTLVSFDTERDTVEALQAFRAKMEIESARWALLRGAADDVRELAALLGVSFQRDACGQFAHSNLITVLDAEGEVAHQLTGLKGSIAGSIEAIQRVLDQRRAAEAR